MLRLGHLVLNEIYEFFFVFFICGFVYMIQLAFDASVNAFLSFGTRVYKRNSRFWILFKKVTHM